MNPLKIQGKRKGGRKQVLNTRNQKLDIKMKVDEGVDDSNNDLGSKWFGYFKNLYKPTCTHCGKQFQCKRGLTLHMRNHDKSACTCRICGVICASIRLLSTHLKCHHPLRNKLFRCKICERPYDSVVSLRAHERSHEKDVTYKCSICGKIYVSANAVRTHRRNEHKDQLKQNVDECEPCFPSQEDVDAYMKLHEGSKHTYWSESNMQSSEPETWKGFDESSSFGNHLTGLQLLAECAIAVSRQPQSEIGLCNQQGSNNTIKTSSQGKVKVPKVPKVPYVIHDGVRTIYVPETRVGHVCKICKKMFEVKHKLIKHMRSHNDLNFCDSCPMIFQTFRGLNSHKRVHLGPESKKFKCFMCENGFTTEYNLKNHLLTHGQVVPDDLRIRTKRMLKCSYCEREFKKHKSLFAHEQLHFGIAAFKCEVCQVSYPTNNGFEKHLSSNWHAINLQKN